MVGNGLMDFLEKTLVLVLVKLIDGLPEWMYGERGEFSCGEMVGKDFGWGPLCLWVVPTSGCGQTASQSWRA